MKRTAIVALLAMAVMTMAPAVHAEEGGTQLEAAKRAAGTVNGLCPVMGNPVKRQGGSAEYRGEKIGFCCPGCVAKFQADPVRYMDTMRVGPAKYAYGGKGPSYATLTKAARAAGSANGLCPVMGNPVQRDGGAVMYKEQKIAFCCPPCQAKFTANPEGYMAKVRDEAAVYGYVRAPQGAAHGGHGGH